MGTSHFDAIAADWDSDPDKVARAREVASAIAGTVPLTPQTRLLEYGAGTGLVSQALADRVGPVTLADNSAGMRAVLQEKVDAGILPGARVWDLDLESQPPPKEAFDLIVTSLVLHHVKDLERVLRGFAGLLAPDGHLCVVDLDRDGAGSFHAHDFDGHHGFDRTELTAQLADVGLGDVSLHDGTDLTKEGVTYSVFLAVARRGG